MGAISGLVTIAVAFWFYQTIIDKNQALPQEEKVNAWIGFWIGAGSYFGGYMIGVLLNGLIITMTGGAEPGEATGANTGIKGIIQEFLPLIAGILVAFFVRQKWLLKKYA